VAGSPSRLAVALGIRRPAEAEEAAGSHRPGVAEEVDTHLVVAEEVGSYQGEVAVDRSWTPSSVKLAGNERAYPNLRVGR
jgi:hypothetical protein